MPEVAVPRRLHHRRDRRAGARRSRGLRGGRRLDSACSGRMRVGCPRWPRNSGWPTDRVGARRRRICAIRGRGGRGGVGRGHDASGRSTCCSTWSVATRAGRALVDVEPAVLEDMLGQHVWSTFHVARAVAPGMVERGWGRIVAVATVATTTPGPRQGPYLAAKSAQETLLRVLAREVAGTRRDRQPGRGEGHRHRRRPRSRAVTEDGWLDDPCRDRGHDALAVLGRGQPVNGARIPLDGA